MAEDINLLPQQGEENKAEVHQRKMLNQVGSIVLAIAILVVVVLGGVKITLEQQIRSVGDEISQHEAHIQSMKAQEGVYRSLTGKLSALTTFFSAQHHYSTVLNELAKTMPASVKLTDITVLVAQDTTITGTADSYADLAGFYNKLSQAGAKNGSTVGTYFMQPQLASISRNDVSGEISFSMKFGLGKQLLATAPEANQ